MTNDNNIHIDTMNVIQTPLNVAATDATGVTTAGTITASTASATTTTTLPVGNAAYETARHSLFGAAEDTEENQNQSETSCEPTSVWSGPTTRSRLREQEERLQEIAKIVGLGSRQGDQDKPVSTQAYDPSGDNKVMGRCPDLPGNGLVRSTYWPKFNGVRWATMAWR
ncbi:hypothetical protein F2Q69_00011349 [Brassica cretica]|uniref:Uncharacterized protein n=1 Tax=Brassica cretica TaxID=69181 RepID=A0A8S9R837_BRACR|nr:hypothetical protein F2Q69_00011349 [Brassica cretica]